MRPEFTMCSKLCRRALSLVYLGDIYLPQNIYYLPTCAIVHMCLMALGGKVWKEDLCSFFKNETD
jgi:hypothetical protein